MSSALSSELRTRFLEYIEEGLSGLGIDTQFFAQRRVRSLRSLYCSSDGVRGRGAPVTNLSHMASFHSIERITPSNRGIKQLEYYIGSFLE
ncbi:hypothetical protein SuNHUV7_24750 (plasmid) [Pseudoseohaeicola sp. NH-UV-7]